MRPCASGRDFSCYSQAFETSATLNIADAGRNTYAIRSVWCHARMEKPSQ